MTLTTPPIADEPNSSADGPRSTSMRSAVSGLIATAWSGLEADRSRAADAVGQDADAVAATGRAGSGARRSGRSWSRETPGWRAKVSPMLGRISRARSACIEHRDAAEHIVCLAADAGDDDLVAMVRDDARPRRCRARRSESRPRLWSRRRRATACWSSSAAASGSGQSESQRAQRREQVWSENIVVLIGNGSTARSAATIAMLYHYNLASSNCASGYVGGRMFVTHLECSLTGERYEAGQIHNLSRGGQAAAGPLRSRTRRARRLTREKPGRRDPRHVEMARAAAAARGPSRSAWASPKRR